MEAPTRPHKSRFSSLAGSFKRSAASVSVQKRPGTDEGTPQNRGQFFRNLGFGNRGTTASRADATEPRRLCPAESGKTPLNAVVSKPGIPQECIHINRRPPTVGHARAPVPVYNTLLMENFETMDVRLPIAQQPASPTRASELLALESCLSEDSPENAKNVVAERKEEGTAVDQVSDPLSPAVSSPSSCEAPSSFISPVFASSASGDSISIYSCSSAPVSPLAGLANSADSDFEGRSNLHVVSNSPENAEAGNQDHPDARTFDLEDDVSFSDSLNIPLRKLKAVYQRTLRSDRSIELQAKNLDLLEPKIPPRHNPGSPLHSQASEQALEDVLSVTSDDLDRDFRSFWPYNKSLHTSLRNLPPLGGQGARGRPHKGFQGTPSKGRRGRYLDAPPLSGPGPLTPTPVTPPDLERLSFHDSSVIHSSSEGSEGSEALGLSARERRARGYGQIYDDIHLSVGQWSCNGPPSDCSASFPQKPLVSDRGYRDQPLLQPRHILERKAKSGPRPILRAGPAF